MKVTEFFGTKVVYDKIGTMLFGVQKNGHHQMVADVRGWGAIQNLFKNPNGTIRESEAEKFQDDMGQFMADAINEKVQGVKKRYTQEDMLRFKRETELGSISIFANKARAATLTVDQMEQLWFKENAGTENNK